MQGKELYQFGNCNAFGKLPAAAAVIVSFLFTSLPGASVPPPPPSLKAAVFSRVVRRCFPSNRSCEETLNLCGVSTVTFPASPRRVHLPPPGGAPGKDIRPLIHIVSPFPSLPLSPSLFSRLSQTSSELSAQS